MLDGSLCSREPTPRQISELGVLLDADVATLEPTAAIPVVPLPENGSSVATVVMWPRPFNPGELS